MTERDVALVEKMNLFPEVAWDRWGGWYDYPVEHEGEGVSTAAPFGWIEREGSLFFDFFVLHVFWTAEHGIYHVGSDTSSARYSREFSERLGIGAVHLDCRRIADDLPGVSETVAWSDS